MPEPSSWHEGWLIVRTTKYHQIELLLPFTTLPQVTEELPNENNGDIVSCEELTI